MTIYIILNDINGKVYIGQTIKDPFKRWKKHLHDLKSNGHCNRHLQNAWNKVNDETKWSFHIFKTYSDIDDLNIAEEFYIAEFKSINRTFGYNLSSGGKNKFHSEESKLLMSKSKIGNKNPSKRKDVREKLRNLNLGKRYGKRKPETIEKMIKNHGRYWKGKKKTTSFKNKVSKKLKGKNCFWFGKTLTEEHRRKISNSLKSK